MANKLAVLFILLVFIVVTTYSQTYYSRNATSGGNWNSPGAWSSNSDGSGGAAGVPGRTDDVVILNGHNINITATNNNGSTGVSPDGLGYPNVGTFAQSGTACFYQIGNITVNSGGSITSTTRLLLEGYTLVEGTLTSTGDLINVGQLVVNSGATLSTDDDVVLTGNSTTEFNATVNSDDDLYLDHTDAKLCGSGVMNVGVTSPNTPIISYTNSATIAQICAGFQVSCGPDPGCSGFPQTGTGGFSYDLSGFEYYKYITIESTEVPGDLTNFPVLLSFSDADLRTTGDGGHVQSANGYDIIFSSSNNCGQLSQLKHELVSYSSNVTTGTIIAWVNVPSVSSSTDTELFMYYGNDSITSDQSTGATYDYDYINVHHLDGVFTDASLYSNDGTNGGTANQSSGKIASARTFGAGDYIQIPTSDMTNSSGTYSSWVYSTSFTTNHHYIAGHTTLPAWSNRLQLYTNDNGGNLDLGLGGSHALNTGIYNFNTSEWYHVALTWNSGNYIVYVNGSSQATGTYSSFSSLHTFMDIGNDGNASNRGENWVGDIDETRVSKIQRSANWIETSFNNQDDPSAFFTVGTEIANTCIALPIELLSFKAFPVNNEIVSLEWSTASEINNDFYTIERSRDTKNWEIVKTQTGAGNSQSLINYSDEDREPFTGRSYYRLKQTDYNGKSKYSKTVTVNLINESKIELYPNPNNGKFTLLNSTDTPITNIRLYDALNKEVEFEIDNLGQSTEIDASQLKNGIYFLRYANNGNEGVKKLIIDTH